MTTPLPECDSKQRGMIKQVLTFFFAFFIFGAEVLQAQITDSNLSGIVMNEYMADPNGSNNFDTDGSGDFETEDEFFELYNSSESAVDISGWEIWDKDGQGFIIPDNSSLPAGGYVVFIHAVSTGGSLDNIAGDLKFETNISFTNGGDGVLVFDPSSDTYTAFGHGSITDISSFSDFTTANASASIVGDFESSADSDGQSISRVPNGGSSFTNQTPTPGTSNGDEVTGPTEVATIADFRALDDGTEIVITGEVFITHTTSERNQKWVQDATGGLVIDDNNGIITSNLSVGDGITGLTGTKGNFSGLVQLVPTESVEASSSENVLTNTTVTIAELNSTDFQGQLVTVQNVSFSAADGTLAFGTGSDDGDLGFGNYEITDGTNTSVFRAEYSDANYIGLTVPMGERSITGVVSEFNGTAQLIGRNGQDFGINPPFTLQLLHYADVDGNEDVALDAIDEFSALVNGFQNDVELAANTLTVTSGDIMIPGPRYTVAEQGVIRSETGSDEGGHIDVVWANAFGVDAATIGNHELDLGTGNFYDAAFQSESRDGNTFPGSTFPWLSANIDFSGDSDFSGVTAMDGQPLGDVINQVAKSAIAEINGERIGLVGAASPTFPAITSTAGLEFSPGVDFEIADLAAEIQPTIDALIADGVNKIVLISHMQQISVEKALAEELTGVDIIVAGGSNTRMGNDEASSTYSSDLIADDSFDEPYPFIVEKEDKEPVLIVNVDGDYKYLGRLVVDFNRDGTIIPASISKSESSSFASTQANVDAVGGTPISEVVELRDLVNTTISDQRANVIGYTDVYLDGRRGAVRTQETNLGNLTADANLWYANALNPEGDDPVLVSIKNGGGIRAEIGTSVIPPGATDDSDTEFFAPENGEISEFDLNSVLRFNNGLVRLTLSAEELVDVIEHAISATEEGATPGQFPQVGGMKFTYDASLEAGSRVVSVTVMGADDNEISVVADGALVDATLTFNIVTLNFLANGGDGYPFDGVNAAGNRINFYEGEGFGDPLDFDDANLVADPGLNNDISDTGGEQDALAEYMLAFYGSAETAFDIAETPSKLDSRIRSKGRVLELDPELDTFVDALNVSLAGSFQVPGDVFAESAAEIISYDAVRGQAFFTDANSDLVHVLNMNDPSSPTLITSITLEGSPNSVAVYGDLVAVATEADPKQDPGAVEFFSAVDYMALGSVAVGALPDMVTFNEDGTKILTANEGEPNDEYTVDPEGSISIVTLNMSDLSASTVATAGFTAFNDNVPEGVRIFGPDATVAQDLEPEYITVSGNIAYVACQENNALAIVDIETATVTSLLALGTQDHSEVGNGIDASNRDGGIFIAQWDVQGFYMPDAIASYTVGENTYLVTANEGDARDYDGYSEEARMEDLELDPEVFPNADFLQMEENLGRLKTTIANGDTDGDGDVDVLYSYGTRSFTIWNAATGDVVWDSKNAFEQLTAQRLPEYFNATNDENNFDNRSDDKGPEPEGVVLGEVNGAMYAFVGLERVGGIVTYDISDPANPVFANYINNRDFSVSEDDIDNGSVGDLGPEGLAFVPANQSPNNTALLIVTNEVTGTVTTYEVGTALATPTIELSADVTTVEGAIVTLTATSSDIRGIDATVSVSVSGASAEDYVLSAETITIAAGETTGTVTLTLEDDAVVEATEEVTVTLSAPSLGVSLGTVVSSVIMITDNDASVVSLSADANTGSEADATVITLTVTADQATVADQSVDIAVTGASGADYSLSASTITIAEGSTTGTATITVVNDDEVEEDEAITATISNPSSQLSLGATNSVTITITSDDVLGLGDGLEGLSVYPVPAVADITIQHESMNISKVNVFSIGGKLIQSAVLENNKLNVRKLESGTYILELIDAKTSNAVRVKILKK